MDVCKISTRQQLITRLSKIHVENVDIIDWGSGGRKVERYIKHKKCNIISVDSRARRIPTIVADMCEPMDIKKCDLAFCLQALEHCVDPDGVLDNIYNNLKDDGKVFISVPFICRVHSSYDYWRWTKLGIRTLLEKHGFKIINILEMREKGQVNYFIELTKDCV